MKKIYLFLYFALLTSSILGQTPITTNQYLETFLALSSSNLPFAKNIEFIANSPDLKLIREVGIRAKLNDMDFRSQEFTFRTKFFSLEEKKAHKKLKSINESSYHLMQNEYLLNNITTAYETLNNLYFLTKKNAVLDKKLNLLIDKKSIYSKLLSEDSKGNFQKYLSNEKEIFQIKEKINRNNEIKTMLLSAHSVPSEIFFSNWIDITEIKNVIKSLSQKKSQLELIRAYELKKSEAEYNLEIAENHRWLDFVQIKYQTSEKMPLYNEFSIGTGLILPFKGLNKIKQNEAYLDILDKEAENKIELENERSQFIYLKSRLSNSLKEFNRLSKFISVQNLTETIQELKNISEIKPILLINLQLETINNQEDLLNIEEKIYNIYIQLLARSGIIIQKPILNYLTNGLFPLNN